MLANNEGKTALILACELAQTDLVTLLLEEGGDPNISDAYGNTALHSAVYGCCTNESLQEIITHQAYPNAQNNDGETALLLACFYRQQEMVKILLKAGSNSNIAAVDGDTSLHAAVLGNCSKNIIRTIIYNGAYVNAANEKNVTTLMLASKEGNVDAIKVLISAGADRTIKDANGDTWIHYAFGGYGGKEVLQSIIDRGADVNATNKKNCTALMLASEKGNVDGLNVLLSAGANTTVKDVVGNTWLHYAIYGACNKDIVQSIIDQGADVNAANNENATALMLASKKGSVDAINVLISAGADQTIEDANGNTWIHYAFGGDGNKDVLQSIIDLGADVNATNKENATALMLASEKGNVDGLTVLLSAGANTTLEDAVGNTWIHYAIYGDCSKEILQSIIDLGADVNAKNNKNTTALMLAIEKGNAAATNVLLSAGANTLENAVGSTWMHYAIHEDLSKEVLQLIIDLGADVNATNHENATALMLAIEKGNADVINILINAGASMAVENAVGNTWIHYAVSGDCDMEVLQSVIHRGADVNATNKQNVTALMLASQMGNLDAMNVLLSAGANHTTANANGDTWIHYAIYGDCSKEVLQLIIDEGADVNATNNENVTALMLASKKGNINAMNVLITAGADQTIEDADGNQWIHCAVHEYCTKEVLQLIIDLGADVNARNKQNITALMLASFVGNRDAMKVLLSAGANKATENVVGNTWIHYAIHGDCSKDVLQSIIDAGADVNATNKQNCTALMLAGLKENVDAINVLLSAGADQTTEDANGDTWIHYAVHGDCSKEVLHSMIDLGADVNAANKRNCTALMLACMKGNLDAINVLLSAGADRTIEDSKGNIWIHYAIHGDIWKEDLPSIIDLGVDVSASDQQNRTALKLVSMMGNVDTMNVLPSAGPDTLIAATKGDTLIYYSFRFYCNNEVLQSITDLRAIKKDKGTALMLASKKLNVNTMNVLFTVGPNQTVEDVAGNKWIYIAVHGDCREEVLQSVIDLGADVNATNKENRTALMLASNKGNIDAMNVLITAGADQTIKDVNGNTWIHYAVHGDCRKEVLRSMIGLGADVNAANNRNTTALMLACMKSNVDAMNVLLSAGADRTIEDANGNIWIHYAVLGDCRKEVLQSIIDLDANVNARNKQNCTALMFACLKGNEDAMNVLLSFGADRIIEDDSGNTWIHYAVLGDCSKEVLHSMIDLGADVNAANKKNCTALMFASLMGNVDAMKVLLNAGANMAIENVVGNTWIHYAIYGDCSKDVIQSIIDLGADVNATNKENCTALMLTSLKGNVDAMKVLLSAGADRTIKDADGNVWVHYAVYGDIWKEVLQSMIDLGADVNAANKKNCTAIMLACMKGNVDTMKVLLSAGTDRSIEDADGNVWVHYAVYGDIWKEVLLSVINLGADANASEEQNRTASMSTSLIRNVDAMNVLPSAGADTSIEAAKADTLIYYSFRFECNKEVLQSITDQGADVNAMKKDKVTALMLASKKLNINAMNVLITAGADQAMTDIDGNKLIFISVDGNCREVILQSLIDQGVDVNAKNKKGCTALMLASMKGNINDMNVLITAGADQTIKDADGDTWIHYAVHGDCRKDVLQAMIDLGADVNAANNRNTTALMLACMKSNVDAINVLLSAGADRTIEDANGNIWIHYAVLGDCRKEVLQSIIDLGADVNARNKENCTALMLACFKGNVDAINVLFSAGAD